MTYEMNLILHQTLLIELLDPTALGPADTSPLCTSPCGAKLSLIIGLKVN
jgi:hypothetical protein